MGMLEDAEIRLLEGGAQAGEAAAVLAEPLVVEVRDGNGIPIVGAPVEWTFRNGLGAADRAGPMTEVVRLSTDTHGRAAVRWQLDTIIGEQRAIVRIVKPSADAVVDGATPDADLLTMTEVVAQATSGTLSAILVTPDRPVVAVGGSFRMTAVATDQAGTPMAPQPSFTWSSSNTSVATVSSTGMVTAKKLGTATIRARTGGVTGSESVAVVTKPVVAQVVVAPTGATLAAGQTARFTATALDGSGRTIPVATPQWGFTVPSIGSVDATGLVTAIAPGSAWVWAIVEGITGSQPVTITSGGGSPSAPGTVSDLQVVSTTTNSVTLRWTQVTNGSGGAAHYALRRGSPTISWANAATTEVSVQGTQVGSAIQYTWSGLSAGSTQQFQLVAYRGTLGSGAVLGSLSNVASATLPSGSSPPPPAGSSDVLFHSDWSTATGTSGAAIRDTGKARPWTSQIGSDWQVRSTAADGRDYPTANYLRVGNQWLELSFERSDGYIPVPQVGESVYVRMYYRMILSGSSGDTHGTYFDDSNSNPNWGPQALGWYLYPNAGGTFTYMISAAAGLDPRYFSPSSSLQKNTTYRIEARYHRTGTNTYQIENRIYSANGTLLYDTNSLCDRWWHSCSGYALAGRTFTTSGAGAVSMTGFKIGIESGQGGAMAEYAGIAICRTNWCGPYRDGK